MSDEEGIGFLVDLAESQRSTALCELVSEAASHLIASWDHSIAEFRAVLELLEEVAKKTWFLAHGGRAIYSRLLNGVLGEIALASAEDWRKVLAFPQKALEWTETHESLLEAGLKRYRERGVDDDISNCTTLDDMAELRESLDQLAKEFGLDLVYDIERLDEQMAEREGEDPEDRYSGGTGFSRSAGATEQQVVTDEDIRQMFGTLRGN
jgi:hypothetical protein